MTKCFEIPAVTDDPEFRRFLGFPDNLMTLKARGYTIIPQSIDHGEGDNEEDGTASEEDAPPPPLVVPPLSVQAVTPSSSNSGATSIPTSTGSNVSASPPPQVSTLPPAEIQAPKAESPVQRTSTRTKDWPKPPEQDDAIAMFDYPGKEPGELAFKIGEIVHLIESQAPADWAAGFTKSSTPDKPGYFPRAFVRQLTSEDYVYHSSNKTWVLRDDIADFTYDPNSGLYNYNKPQREPAVSLYQ